MVRQRGGYWRRPVSRTYMYNLDVGEHYYQPMTSYLEAERGTRGETPGALTFEERLAQRQCDQIESHCVQCCRNWINDTLWLVSHGFPGALCFSLVGLFFLNQWRDFKFLLPLWHEFYCFPTADARRHASSFSIAIKNRFRNLYYMYKLALLSKFPPKYALFNIFFGLWFVIMNFDENLKIFYLSENWPVIWLL